LFNVEIKNPAIKPKAAFLSLVATGSSDSAESMDRKLVYYDGHKYHTEALSSELEFKSIPGEMRWMGAVTRYFALAIVEEGSKGGAPRPTALVQNAGLVGGTHSGRISLVYSAAGPRISIPVKVYLGPKELNVIKKVDKSLDLMVDFGFFSAFAYPLLLILKWIQGVVVNWGVAIILLTVLVKIVTFPLNYKSMKSMRELSKLTPQIQKLKEKYKDDKQKQNQEMMMLMKNNKANPLAGCLPILVQMPVFFALYSLLYSAFELYGAPFGFWIQDLSVKDPFYVTPVLLTALMYLQQKLTPNTVTDPMQAKMMQLMPVIFGVFMISLPSGLAIYMLTNSAVSIVQQVFLNKHLDKLYGPIVVPKPAVAGKA
jgi:YidC/Oxa1 family membrane protein insertase